jgi:hypothetical protein
VWGAARGRHRGRFFDVERWPSRQGRCETSRFHHRLSVRANALYACPLFAPTPSSRFAINSIAEYGMRTPLVSGLIAAAVGKRPRHTRRTPPACEPRFRCISTRLPLRQPPEAPYQSWRSRLHGQWTTDHVPPQQRNGASALSCSACWSGCSFTHHSADAPDGPPRRVVSAS